MCLPIQTQRLSQAEPSYWRWLSGISADAPAEHEGSLNPHCSEQALMSSLSMRTWLLLKTKQKKIKQKQLVCYSIFNLHRPAQTVQMTHLHNHTSEWNRHIAARPLSPIPPLVLQWDHREQLSSLTTVVVRAPEVSASYILEQAQHWHGCSHLSVISVHPQSLKLYWLNVKIYYLSFAVKAHPQHLSSASFPQHLLIS